MSSWSGRAWGMVQRNAILRPFGDVHVEDDLVQYPNFLQCFAHEDWSAFRHDLSSFNHDRDSVYDDEKENNRTTTLRRDGDQNHVDENGNEGDGGDRESFQEPPRGIPGQDPLQSMFDSWDDDFVLRAQKMLFEAERGFMMAQNTKQMFMECNTETREWEKAVEHVSVSTWIEGEVLRLKQEGKLTVDIGTVYEFEV